MLKTSKSETKPKKTIRKPNSKQIVKKPEELQIGTVSVSIDEQSSPKENEYMSDEQLEHFRTILLQRKEQLIEDISSNLHAASNHPDLVDMASIEEEIGLELCARKQKGKMFKKIEAALVRIGSHNYGYCDNCGAEIGINRLEAHPAATQCVDCRAIAEIKEKQLGEEVVVKDYEQD